MINPNTATLLKPYKDTTFRQNIKNINNYHAENRHQ